MQQRQRGDDGGLARPEAGGDEQGGTAQWVVGVRRHGSGPIRNERVQWIERSRRISRSRRVCVGAGHGKIDDAGGAVNCASLPISHLLPPFVAPSCP